MSPYATTLCHWVRSFQSSDSLSFQEILVATENLVTLVPFFN